LVHVPEDTTTPYHMYASAFVLGCGLHTWETNSQIVHLVSTDLEKPFVFSDVVLPPWHHGVGATRVLDGTFVIFSMGWTNSSWPVPCVGGEPLWKSSFNCTRPPVGSCHGQAVRGHWSKSAYGPWTPILNPTDGSDILWTAVNPDPSPWVLPNGTICVVGGGIRCADHYLGPYIEVPGGKFPRTNNSDPRLHGGHAAAEDPYLWTTGDGVDLRWHQLWHQKIDNPTNRSGAHDQCTYFPYVGGYGKSKSAELSGEWDHDFFRPAFGLNITLKNGSSFCLTRRERPKLVNIEGRMWLTNGAQSEGLPGDGPGDRGVYTFIQEVLSISSRGQPREDADKEDSHEHMSVI